MNKLVSFITAELAKIKDPRRFERHEKSSRGQAELVKEAKTIIGL